MTTWVKTTLLHFLLKKKFSFNRFILNFLFINAHVSVLKNQLLVILEELLSIVIVLPSFRLGGTNDTEISHTRCGRNTSHILNSYLYSTNELRQVAMVFSSNLWLTNSFQIRSVTIKGRTGEYGTFALEIHFL